MKLLRTALACLLASGLTLLVWLQHTPEPGQRPSAMSSAPARDLTTAHEAKFVVRKDEELEVTCHGHPSIGHRVARAERAVLGRVRGAGPLARGGSYSPAERPIHLVEVLLQGAYDNEARLGRADRLPGVAPRRSDKGHCRGGPSF